MRSRVAFVDPRVLDDGELCTTVDRLSDLTEGYLHQAVHRRTQRDQLLRDDGILTDHVTGISQHRIGANGNEGRARSAADQPAPPETWRGRRRNPAGSGRLLSDGRSEGVNMAVVASERGPQQGGNGDVATL